MKRRLIAPLAAVLLFNVGCTTTRFVAVKCLNIEQYQKLKDAEPKRVGDRLNGNAQDDIKTIAGSAVELRTYSEGLLGVIHGCVGK